MNRMPTITDADTTVTSTTVCQELLSLLKQFKAYMGQVAEKHGLTTMQLHALHAIADGHTTMGKVAQTMHCDASNVTGIVDRLTALQLVIRQEDPRDRRVKSLQLTPQGNTILQEVIAELPERLGCSRLNQQELNSLHSSVLKLITE
jgi:DNA-binding MarR family transcriptional regulator